MGRTIDGWPVVEPVPVRDIFATEFAEIEFLGSNVRFTLASRQHIAGTSSYELEIVGRIVLSHEDAIRMTQQSADVLRRKLVA